MKNLTTYGITLLAIMHYGFTLAQQTPTYSQYIYNTMTTNPGYTGSKGHWTALAMHRSQWVGVNGSPTTQNLSLDGPVSNAVGLGIHISNDALGPVNEIFTNINFSYSLKIDRDGKKLSFGLKGGGRVFNVDFTKGITENQDVTFLTDINSKFFPTIGAGIYYSSPKSYFGVSIPNFFSQEFYDASIQKIEVERIHFLFIGGAVFNFNKHIKLKPSFFIKKPQDTATIADIAMNALLKETLNLGVSYRFNTSISSILGLQLTPRLHAGYAYEMSSNNPRNNFGTHEIFLRFEFKSEKKTFEPAKFF